MERANENREMTAMQGASAFMRIKRITKENGSIYNSTRARVNSSDWLLPMSNLFSLSMNVPSVEKCTDHVYNVNRSDQRSNVQTKHYMSSKKA